MSFPTDRSFQQPSHVFLPPLLRFHVSDEMAFPLLLRGLSPAWAWTDLVRAEIPKEREKKVIDSPQDLLLFDFDEVTTSKKDCARLQELDVFAPGPSAKSDNPG